MRRNSNPLVRWLTRFENHVTANLMDFAISPMAAQCMGKANARDIAR
jgi:hypothetical protein